MTLKDIAIFKIKPLITNFNSKLSAATENNTTSQLLCLVHDNNDLFLRYTTYEFPTAASSSEASPDRPPCPSDQVTVKLLPWFNEHGKVIRDICFEPSNERLLVLCDDNTLHVVPVLAIVQEQLADASASSATLITSYVVPFVGPHECPNPRTCPNNFYRPPNVEKSLKTFVKETASPTLDQLYSKQAVDKLLSARDASSTYFNGTATTSTATTTTTGGEDEEQKEHQQIGVVCPYPTAVVWWHTKRMQDRAIVGYSDGSVCFLSLTPNCPFIANTTLSDAVSSFDICRDTSGHTVTLLITTSKNTQWKLLLEEQQSRYIFPGDSPTTVADNLGPGSNKIDQDWQFVVAAPSPPQITVSSHSGSDSAAVAVPKLFPAGISYLREMGTRKIGALKQRLSAEKIFQRKEEEEEDSPPKEVPKKDSDDDWSDDPPIATFIDVLETPSVCPEMITSAHGPRIVVKNHNTRTALFALNSRQETVSVHNLNMDPEPYHVYCLPDSCHDVLVTQNTIYTVQKVTAGQRSGRVGTDGDRGTEEGEEGEQAPVDDGEVSQQVTACGVVSRTLALKSKETDLFEDRALVTYFPFHAENVINIHGQFTQPEPTPPTRNMHRREMSPAEKRNDKLTVKDYVKQRGQFEGGGGGSEAPEATTTDLRILQTTFPCVTFDSVFVVTDRNVYAIEMNDAPEAIFMNFAKQSMWSSCKYFCDIFNVSMAQCIEYVGDELLRQHKVTQALVTYNVAQIPPIKTALKLATYGESNALLHLCAMALKCIYVLKSSRPSGCHAKRLMEDLPLRTIRQKREMGGEGKGGKKRPEGDLNSGQRCSDFSYDHDEVGMDVQMSYSSQFHLANLLLLTLCERTLTEKRHFPLWSFVEVNQRFHTSLASTILAQSGLYATAVLLAKVRGAGLDVFGALVKAFKGEIGTDVNYLLYNLSEGEMFREALTYRQRVAVEYFVQVAGERGRFSVHVVDRLVEQLNPFAACFRPIVSRLSGLRHEHRRGRGNSNKRMEERVGEEEGEEEDDELFPLYCKTFVEAFLAVLVRSVEMREGGRSHVINGLRGINIRYEANVVEMMRRGRRSGGGNGHQLVAAGYAHACRVVDGRAYIWGSNQIPYVVDDKVAMAPGLESSSLGSQPKLVKFLSRLSVTVLSVHCGRTHTLMYTNNGLYAMGGNSLGQLGVGSHISVSLHPVLVERLMDLPLEMIAVGQYHNAVVARGQVYVWGWGVYGQLGNGGVEDVHVPTVLPFFNGRKIKQIALGHVHSLVLCESESPDECLLEDLYVFGSNYFGQLGTGPSAEQGEEKGLSKALVPVRLDLNERIRSIHTNFFVNFAVTESNELLTWGASPQALRVINQARKRARSQIRSELAKEKEAALERQESEAADKENAGETPAGPSSSSSPPLVAPIPKRDPEKRPKIEAKKSRRHSLSNLAKLKATRRSPGRLQRSPSDESLPKRPTEAPPTSLKRRSEKSPENVSRETSKPVVVDLSDLDEWMEHLRPTKVDTSNVEEGEDILEVASGLYHFALRTTRGVYTWGKNIEKQLGNDSSRADVAIPTQLETIRRPISVECGADFTLVLVARGEGDGEEGKVLLAFGNNNMGQCGRETGEKSALMGKWVRLKISKRHIRIPDGSACVSAPTEVLFAGVEGIGRGKEDERVAAIRSLPEFKRRYLATSRYLREFVGGIKTQMGDGGREVGGKEVVIEEKEEEKEKEGENVEMTLEGALNSIQLDKSEEESSGEMLPPPPVDDDKDKDDDDVDDGDTDDQMVDGDLVELPKNEKKKTKADDNLEVILKNGLPTSSADASDFIHYCLYLFYGIYDTEAVAERCAFAEFRIRLKMLQAKFFEAFQIALKELVVVGGDDEVEQVRQSIVLFEFFTKDENLIPMHEEDLKYFIQAIFVHFIERGWELRPLEEYFQQQLNLYVIPLAYVLFFEVAGRGEEQVDLEGDGTEGMRMMLGSSDVGGGGGSKQLRDSVLLKYRTFFNHLECAPQKYRVAGAAEIFERVSVVFNALICQRVVEIFDRVVGGEGV